MRLHDIFERVVLDHPGSNRVIDLRSEKRKNSDTHITLTKDHSALIWNYADGNKIPWSPYFTKDKTDNSITGYVSKVCDTSIQPDYMDIRFTTNGILIGRSRVTGNWGGDRNKYSMDIKPVVSRLLDLKIILPRTPVYLGNWARKDSDAEMVGTAAQIMNAPKVPNKIVLYHGTSNVRAKIILEQGIKPLDKDSRAWREKGEVPDHRNDSIYLTASLAQAEYYATKTSNIDRKRLTIRFRKDQEYKIRDMHNTIATQKLYKNFTGAEETQSKIEQLQKSLDLLNQMNRLVDKVHAVILEVTLTREDYKKLLADDDYISSQKIRKGIDVSPTDWRESLSHFGQVAFRGTISPDKIKLL
jgi:hypothetical protein